MMKSEISQKIYGLRSKFRMSQEEFAKHIGISRQSIGFYESGKRVPDANTIKLICEKCNVSSDWLLGLSCFVQNDISVSEISNIVSDTVRDLEKAQARLTHLIAF